MPISVRLLCLLTLTANLMSACRPEGAPPPISSPSLAREVPLARTVSPSPDPTPLPTHTAVTPPSPTPSSAAWIELDTLTFPADVPLTVDHGVIMWSVQVHDQRYRVPTRLTQSTFADTCDLNADRSIALCKAYQDMDQVDALLVQMTNPHTYAAVRAAFFDLFANRNPFVLIRKDTSAVVPLTREMDPRTNCRWYDARQVACTTSHGTGVWTVMLFDTIQMDYTPLPTAGNIEWSYAFRRGYVHVQDAPPELQQFTIYGFDSTIMTQFRTFYLATTADTLLYITPCDAGKLCVQGLVIGTAGIERSHRWDLGLTEQETRRCAWEIRLQGDQAIIHACNQQVVIALSEL